MIGLLRSIEPPSDPTDLVEALQSDGLDAWDYVLALGIFVGAIVISRIVKLLARRALDRRMDTALAVLIARLLAYVVILVGLVYSLDSLGVAVGPVLGALGIVGIAIAFALQDILENFVAGILLQLKRPFNYGDQVHINGHEGVVQAIDSRLVTILTVDGETVMIPSATVINNYTHHGARRTTLSVGVAYGTDLRRARNVLLDATQAVPEVLDEPEPEVLLEGFGESSIDFVVRFWHRPTIADFWSARSEVAFAVDQSLAAAGITIPFPQRTVHMGDADDSGRHVDTEEPFDGPASS